MRTKEPNLERGTYVVQPLFVLLFLCAIMLNGCAAQGRVASTPHTLNYGIIGDVSSLNPYLSSDDALSDLSALTMAWLIKTGPHNNLVPELALQIPTRANGGLSSDGKKIVYHLRHGVRWSDGYPFTSKDVAFSVAVIKNARNNVITTDGWDRIVRVETPDAYTVIFYLSKPFATYAYTYFSTADANPCILPEHLLHGLSQINTAAYNDKPVGTGPFKYSSWIRGSRITLVRNSLYFRGAPKLERIVVHILPDRTTAALSIRTHEIDLLSRFSPYYYDMLSRAPGVGILRQAGYYFSHIDLNLKHRPLNDQRVRRALLYGIDRRLIRNKVYHAIGLLQDSPLSPANPVSIHDNAFTEYAPSRANSLLDSAGWRRGKDGWRRKGGHLLALSLATTSGTPDVAIVAEIIRSNLAEIGIQTKVKFYSPERLFATYKQGGILYTGKFDLIMFSWSGDVTGDSLRLYDCRRMPPLGQDVTGYCNSQVDGALDVMRRTSNIARRRAAARLIVSHLKRDVPTIVLFINEELYAYSPRLRGFHPNQLSQFDMMQDVDI